MMARLDENTMYAVYRDYFVLEQIFDTPQEAADEASRCRRLYQGRFSVAPITGKQLRHYTHLVGDQKFGDAIAQSCRSI